MRFRLRRLRDYRQRCQEQLELALAQKQDHLRQAEQTLETLDGQRRALADDVAARRGQLCLGHEMQQWRQSYQGLAQRIQAQHTVIAQARQRLQTARQALIVARQETRQIERLDDKAREQARRTQQRRDQRTVDEIALMRSRYGH